MNPPLVYSPIGLLHAGQVGEFGHDPGPLPEAKEEASDPRGEGTGRTVGRSPESSGAACRDRGPGPNFAKTPRQSRHFLVNSIPDGLTTG